MTVMDNEDPALPDEVDEAEALIACLSDDAELLRRANPECEIAANMEAAADMLEALRATEIGARQAYGELVLKRIEAEAECKSLRTQLQAAHAQIRDMARRDGGGRRSLKAQEPKDDFPEDYEVN